MLTFVTAVRHPLNSSSYDRVGALDATLQSVCRQTDPDFRVVVVCNTKPAVTIDDPRIEFVEVGFAAPSHERTAEIDYNTGVIDKGAKLAVGVIVARHHQPDHLMFIDCDDLLHHGVAEFVNQRVGHPGWFAPSGYLHTLGTNFLQPMAEDFHHKCGSSGIVRTDLIPVPAGLSAAASKDEVIEAIGADLLYRLLGTHGKWEDYLRPSGVTIEPLPFPAAVWMIGTGENASGNLVSSRSRSPIGPEITEAFGLSSPGRLSSAVRQAQIMVHRAVRRVRRR
jgi:hypothetical protein